MAIVQSSLQEETLTRSERAVIRGIYRASQLAEAMTALSKAVEIITVPNDSLSHLGDPTSITDTDKHILKMKAYLAEAITGALVNTKIPSSSPKSKSQPSKVQIDV